MTYPKATDYVSALQDPYALLDPGLRRASFSVHPVMRVPVPASGNSAVVFQATIDHRRHALRFFIRDDASSRERYNSLYEFLHVHQMTDCTAAAQWVDGAIRISGQSWPMVRMEWVEGRALDAYVDALVQDKNTAGLQALAGAWLELVRRMQTERFAHGDLQHGNLLVDTSRRLRLVDFDGCWTPDSVGPSPTETGHPNYQLQGRPWGRWMDTFPGLLVYTALRGLALEPGLWAAYGARENILFTKEDFARPFETPVWFDLRAIGDPGITHGLTQLSAACKSGTGLMKPLESMVEAAAVWHQEAADPHQGVGPLGPTDWWKKTGWAPTQPRPGAAPEAGPSTSSLPPPPPKSPSPTQTDPRFTGARAGSWYPPAPSSSGVGGISAGRTSPPPASAPPPPPSPARKRAGWWVIAIIIGLVALLIMLVAEARQTSQVSPTANPTDNGLAGTHSYSQSPYVTTHTPRPSPTELTFDVHTLPTHVPTPLADSCSRIEPSTDIPAVAALSCSDSPASIKVEYFGFATTTDVIDTYQGSYSTAAVGSCLAGEKGSGDYTSANGDRLGRYSCYTAQDNNVLTWTHEAAGTLAVAYSATATYPSLIEWARWNAGPLP